MTYKYAILLMLVMCGGPSDYKCEEKYQQDVKKYTMDSCLRIFKDFVKCNQVVEDRISVIKNRCNQQ